MGLSDAYVAARTARWQRERPSSEHLHATDPASGSPTGRDAALDRQRLQHRLRVVGVLGEPDLVEVLGAEPSAGQPALGRGGDALDGDVHKEQLPRRFEVDIAEVQEDGRIFVRMFLDGERLGDPLRDNAYDADGYRYHDVFHLAYAAVLGWSPVVRKLMGRKRRSNPVVDEVEDGGRAVVIEEAVAAFAYEYARHHAFLDGVESLDYALLRTIKGLTRGLEGGRASLLEWEQAIKAGFGVWREIVRHRTGRVTCDLLERSIEFTPS